MLGTKDTGFGIISGLFVALLGTLGCDGLEGLGESAHPGGGGTLEPCDPLVGKSKPFQGSLDIALQGDNLKLFTVEHEIRRRAFVQSGETWRELKVTGAGLSDGKNGDKSIFLSLLSLDNKPAVLGYEVKDGALDFAGYAETQEDHEGKEELQEDPAFLALQEIPDFSLPPTSEIQVMNLGKTLAFFAKFDADKYLVVVNAQEGEPGLYVGTSKALDGAQKIRIRRFKDGGTVQFDFEYQGKPGALELPRPPWPDQEPQTQQPASLQLDGKDVQLVDEHRGSVPESLVEGLTFRGCQRAHAGKS